MNLPSRAKLKGMKVISTDEAETHFSQLLEQVKAGEEIIIGENGQPYARLIPFTQGERLLGILRNHLDSATLERLGEAVQEPTDEDTMAAWQGTYSSEN
jgi:prevent-host-death family protein